MRHKGSRMPWSTSNRRARLPPNWATIRRRVLNRAELRAICDRMKTKEKIVEAIGK